MHSSGRRYSIHSRYCFYSNFYSNNFNIDNLFGVYKYEFPFSFLIYTLTYSVVTNKHLLDVALWLHNMRALEWSVAVNVFWRQCSARDLYDSRDVYGNRDPLPAQRAEAAVGRALGDLRRLAAREPTHAAFYARLLADRLRLAARDWETAGIAGRDGTNSKHKDTEDAPVGPADK